MAKAKTTPKTATVKLVRSIYINGDVVPATQPGKSKDSAPVATVITVPAQLASELIANAKAVPAKDGEKPNFKPTEAAESDDFADV